MAGRPVVGLAPHGSTRGGRPVVGLAPKPGQQKKTDGGGLLHALGHAAHVVGEKSALAAHDLKAFPGGTIDFVNTGAVQPWKDVLTTGHVSKKHNAEIDKLINEQSDSIAHTINHPFEDPFATLLLAAPAAHGVGRVAERGVEAGRAAKAGEGVKGVVRAARRTPGMRQRLLNVGDRQVPLHASKSPVVRLAQELHDKIVQKAIDTNPEGKVAAYGHRRAGGSLMETGRYQQRMREVPANLLDAAAKRLAPARGKIPGTTLNRLQRVEQAALELASVNTPAERAIAYHLNQAADGIEPVRNKAIASLYKRVADQKMLTVDEHGDVTVNTADHPKLAAADTALERVQTGGDKILTDHGVRTAEQLQTAVDAPGRYRAGGRYVKPTPGRLGKPSQMLKRERQRLTSLERRHSDALRRDAENLAKRNAAVDRLTATVPTTITRHVPMTEADAQARLAELDQHYNDILQKFAPEVNPYTAEQTQIETRTRNTMRGRMAQGKRPATGRAVEGRIGGGSKTIKTVSQEVRDLAEAKLLDVVAKHPDHPVAQRAAELIAERDQLRNLLNQRAEHAFSNEQPPALPAREITTENGQAPAVTGGPSVALDSPHRERIVTLGHAIEEQRARVARMEKQAASRVEPTGIVGGEHARPGRGFVSYKSEEPKAPSSPAATSPGAVVGEAKPPIGSHANTGANISKGVVPKNITRQAATHYRQLVRFVNTDKIRRAALETGSPTRRSSRDVLVRIPGEKAGPIPVAIEEALGRKHVTVDDVAGIHAALEAHLEDMVPGRADRFAHDRNAAIGADAPAGYKWVDRGILGDLAKSGPGPRGRIARSVDNVNSAVTAATVYFKIGHVGTRVLTNAATNIIQGSATPVQIAKSLNLWKALTDEDRLRALAAAGQHGFAAMPHEGASVAGRVATVGANWWARHADLPFRFNAIAFEARKAGFDTPERFQYMLGKLEDGGQGLNAAESAKIDWVAKRANRAQIAYDRLNEFERRYITRAVWFYPWVKGATMFAGHTLAEHPFKAAGIGLAGQEGRDAQARELGPLPSYEGGLFRIGTPKPGEMPLVADFSTFSPFSTPADLLDLPEYSEAADQLNPALGALLHLATRTNQYGTHSNQPIVDAARSLIAPTPEAQTLEAFLARHSDQSHRMFPKSRAWAGTRDPIMRSLVGPGLPRRLNIAAAAAAAARERAGR